MHKRTGQSTAEYAIVFAVVLATLVGMQVYVRRGVNARLKDASDSAIDAVRAKLGQGGAVLPTDLQYEPYYASSDYHIEQKTERKDSVEEGGVVKRELTGEGEVTKRRGSQTTGIAHDN